MPQPGSARDNAEGTEAITRPARSSRRHRWRRARRRRDRGPSVAPSPTSARLTGHHRRGRNVMWPMTFRPSAQPIARPLPVPRRFGGTTLTTTRRPEASPTRRLRQARIAVALLFLIAGAAIGIWTARMPTVEVRLRLTHPQLSIALFALAVGGLAGM